MLSLKTFLEVPLFGEIVLQAETRSILGSIQFLLTHRNAPLGLLILLFSVLVPIAKLVTIQLALSTRNGGGRLTSFLKAIGRWSMLDVFVAAVTVVFFAFTSVRGTDAQVGVGLYFFAGYGLLSLTTTQLFIASQSTRPTKPGPPATTR